MLYALRYPFSFVVLVVTFVVGVTARGVVQRLISGERRPAWVRANTRRRRTTWLAPYVNGYGCVVAALGGVGWGAPVDISDPRQRSRGRRALQLLAGPVVLAGLGVGLLEIFHAWSHDVVGGSSLYAVATGSVFTKGNFSYQLPSGGSVPFGQVALFLAGVELVAMGVLAIIPIPPLDGGRLVLSLVPRSGFWAKVRYRLDDENWGMLLLLFLALPVIFRRLVLVELLAHIVDPLVRLVS